MNMIEWNKVTWYSKLCAIVFFLAILPVLSFYIGVRYEEAKEASLSIPSYTPESPKSGEIGSKKYVNEKYGFSFEYPADYKVIEFSRPTFKDVLAHDGITVGNKKELEDKNRGEGPATVSIYVSANSQNITPLDWIKVNDPGSNFERRHKSEGSVGYTFKKFAGMDALIYEGDGLYLVKYTAFNKDSHIYWIASASNPSDGLDPLLEIHNKILDSFTFEK